MDSPLSCYESESDCGGEKGLWKLDDPVGYREFWKRSHWDVLSVFIHQRDAVLLDQAVLCSLLSASKDARTAILQGSCRGQACITFEAKSDLKRVRRFSLWLQRHAQVIGELHLQLGDKWSTIADLQTAEASVAAGLHTAAAQQPLAVTSYSCSPATPSMQLALLQHLGSSLRRVQFTCSNLVCGGDALSAGFKARWRAVLGQPAAAAAAVLGGLRSLEITENYKCSSMAAARLQMVSLSQLTSLRMRGSAAVAAGRMQQLPSTLKQLQVTLCQGSQQLAMSHLTALTRLKLSGDFSFTSSDRLPPNHTSATLLCSGDAAGLLPQLRKLQRLHLGENCAPTAGKLSAAVSALSSVTELHLAYKAPSQPCTPAPNLTADSAAWAQLHLRQLSLADLAVPAAVLQQLANLPGGGLSSLELSNCKVESSPRQVAKVLADMRQLRVFKMARLFIAPQQWQNLMAGTRELLRTLGSMKQLHTLEIDDMPLGSIAKELPGLNEGRWSYPQLTLQRLVLSHCNITSDVAYSLLKCCKNVRELSLRDNYAVNDESVGIRPAPKYSWDRLVPVQLPKLEWLDVRGTQVTAAGVAHLPGAKQLKYQYMLE